MVLKECIRGRARSRQQPHLLHSLPYKVGVGINHTYSTPYPTRQKQASATPYPTRQEYANASTTPTSFSTLQGMSSQCPRLIHSVPYCTRQEQDHLLHSLPYKVGVGSNHTYCIPLLTLHSTRYEQAAATPTPLSILQKRSIGLSHTYSTPYPTRQEIQTAATPTPFLPQQGTGDIEGLGIRSFAHHSI